MLDIETRVREAYQERFQATPEPNLVNVLTQEIEWILEEYLPDAIGNVLDKETEIQIARTKKESAEDY